MERDATKPTQDTLDKLDEKRLEIKAILESNLCLGLAPNSEYENPKPR